MFSQRALALVFAFSATALSSQDRGQLVPRDAIATGVVESMALVIERDRLAAGAPDGAAVDLAGRWVVPPPELATGAKSGTRHLANRFGDTRMGISFGRMVAFEGAWIAGYGPSQSWAPALRIVGFRDGTVVGETAWTGALAAKPQWLRGAFDAVDRIVVEARPAVGEAAWFALDDLSFVVDGARQVLDFEDLPWRATLSGSGYRGLTWEIGARRGPAGAVSAVHAPGSGDTRSAAAVAGNALDAPWGGLVATSAPHVTRSFVGPRLFDAGGGWIPPDSCGAVGPDHFVSFVNANVSVWAKVTGQRLVNVAMASFWGVTGGIGDPRVVFDPHSQRYFALAMDGPAGNIHFAVSTSSDPTGSWFKTSFVSGVQPGEWADFPRLGIDARGVYISALIVGPYTNTLWAIDKVPLVSANPSVGAITAWPRLPWEGGPQPCVTYGDPGVEYLISRVDRFSLRVRAIQPPLSAPRLVHIGVVATPLYADNPPPVPALGSTVPLSGGDNRLANAVYRGGSIWTAQGVIDGGRAACRWYELRPATSSVTLVQTGTVADPVRHFIYPSIAVNALNDVVLGFSGAHAGEYAGSWVTGRMASDLPGTMAPPELLIAGEGPYERLDGNGTNRFGDYSTTSVDPTDELAFWTIQEHAGAGNLWKTLIARVEYDWVEYGDGHPGTLGVPEISVLGRPALGSLSVLDCTNSLGATTPGAWLFGVMSSATPLLGGTLLVAPLIALDMQVAMPRARLLLPIPNDPGLLRQSVFVQAVEIDGGASQGVSFTPGTEMRIGR